jgi:hypothetical protein
VTSEVVVFCVVGDDDRGERPTDSALAEHQAPHLLEDMFPNGILEEAAIARQPVGRHARYVLVPQTLRSLGASVAVVVFVRSRFELESQPQPFPGTRPPYAHMSKRSSVAAVIYATDGSRIDRVREALASPDLDAALAPALRRRCLKRLSTHPIWTRNLPFDPALCAWCVRLKGADDPCQGCGMGGE